MATRDTSNDHTIALCDREKPCDRCSGAASFSVHCGAWVCDICGSHRALARCYCGWSVSGADGRRELIEDGETIDPDDNF